MYLYFMQTSYAYERATQKLGTAEAHGPRCGDGVKGSGETERAPYGDDTKILGFMRM